MGKTRETEPMIRRACVLLLCSLTLLILAGCAAPPPETEEPAVAVPVEGAVPAEGGMPAASRRATSLSRVRG